MVKRRKRYKTSKKQRQAWWYSLTPEQQEEYIRGKVSEKRDKRRDEQIAKMKRLGLHYDCSNCIHRKTRSCVDLMPDGCEYYFDASDPKNWVKSA